MSTSKGSGATNGVQPIPAGSRKIVQSLKEIVGCSEAEIYATLKDCNMDPNEAVNRLLTQDPFHEVKSKREKKKEGKEATEFRPRASNNSSNRGGKSGADRYLGRGTLTPYNSSESAPLHGKSTYKKANGSSAYTSALPSAPATSGINRSRGPPGLSDGGASTDNKGTLVGTADAIPSGTQPSSVNHSAWGGVPGQVSMADIVKMGRPHNKATASRHASNFTESGVSSVQNVPIKNDWPSIEKPVVSKVISIPESTIDSEVHPHGHGVPLDNVHQDYGAEEDQDFEGEEDQDYKAEEDQETVDDDIQDYGANDSGSLSSSVRMVPDDVSRGASQFENNMYADTGPHQPQPQAQAQAQAQAHDFEHQEVDEVPVTSVTRNMQHIGLNKVNEELPSEEDTPSVVIPDHLQVQAIDCSHLSFGSFGAGMGIAYSSGTMESIPSNMEEPHSEVDHSSVGHPDTRSSEYYVDDSLRNASDGSLFYRTSANIASHDASAASHPEELKPGNAEIPHGNQYSFPSSNTGYSFDEARHLNATFNQPSSSEMQNLASFSNVMQSYPNLLQSTLLAANVHPSRESEHQYSPFLGGQSMSAKYGNSVSSIGGSTISMPEPPPQPLSGTGVTTGPPLPQHLSMHPYSQPTLPMGAFTNMLGYPFLPHQSYAYMPSAFQQAFPGNSTYHQSLAAALPQQYKNSVSVGSLPQSANIPSGYGALGNVAGNFTMNQSAAPSGTSLNYDDVLSSQQYKDNLISLQQNENAAMWLHAQQNSRTMSAVPPSTYYNYQAQQTQQQPGGAGFRQAQQLSQNYGYPNFYHSQTGGNIISLDNNNQPQQQNPRDGSLGGGSQGQQQQSQLWKNGY